MDNQKRNEQVLNIAVEMLASLNLVPTGAFVEDGEEEGQVIVSVEVEQPAILIGFKGRTLAALQLFISLAVRNRMGEALRVLVDVNNYRDGQKTRLEQNVKDLVEKVMATNMPAYMQPMSAYERRLCHTFVGNYEGVFSESEGEGENRHLVIKPGVKNESI